GRPGKGSWMDLLTPFFTLFGLISLGMLVLKAAAFFDALVRKEQVFPAANKLSKPFWLIVLGLAAVWNVLFSHPIGIINIIGVIAAVVYLVDVRPAVREVSRGSGGGRSGPYGPW
ncbi:MAG: DUF2516 family protein, partial [Streptomycetales bacterium]